MYLKSITLGLLFLLLGTVSKAQDHEYNLDETYSINKNATIHLSSDDADVTIKGTDRSDVHVVVHHKVNIKGWKIESGDFEMDVKNRGGDLYIQEKKNENSKVLLGSIREDYEITIEAPQDVALNISGDDDSYRISDINLAVKLDADDADAEMRGMKGNDFDFNIDDGSIHMDRAQGKLRLRMDDGEFYATDAQFTEIDSDMDDGEVDITTSLTDGEFYLFDTDDGDISLNITGGGGRFEVEHGDARVYAGDNFEKASSHEHQTMYQLPGGKARIKIKTDDGDVELQTI